MKNLFIATNHQNTNILVSASNAFLARRKVEKWLQSKEEIKSFSFNLYDGGILKEGETLPLAAVIM